MIEQQIRFCTTSDGVRIAYSAVGRGPPLVKASNWLTHLEYDWESPVWRHLFGALAENHTLIRYDERGTGLSDRDIDEVSLEGWLTDLEAVVDALELDRFALLAISQGGPAAIEYTRRHPEHVSHLVLYGSFAYVPADEHVQQALLSSLRGGWGRNNPAFRQVFTSLFIPEATTEQMDWYNDLERASASAETAAKVLEEIWRIDIRDKLHELTTPTLVMHRKGDAAVAFECGRELAGLIPNARFVPMDGNNHYVLEQEPEFDVFLETLEEFLGYTAARRRKHAGVTVTVLFTDLVGHTQMMQRLGDEKGRDVLREHERITREVLKVHGGSEVKTMGDGFMASFGSVTRAVECAIALQRAFVKRNESAAEPLHVRVGLNAGEPIAEDGDLFGATVILASRIAAQAGAGEILVPDTVRGLCSGKGFLFADRGQFVPKGFDEGVRLYASHWRENALSEG